MRRLTPLRSRRAVVAELQEDLRAANGELWKAINREFDLQCENTILKDMLAASVDGTRVTS
jgi:hypothetical protein